MNTNTQAFIYLINSYLPEPHSSLLNGIIFGAAIKTNSGFYNEIQRVGLLHIVVLSGANINLLISIVSITLGKFSKLTRALIIVPLIVLFVYFVQPQAPIVRASFMSTLTLVAFIFGRKNLALYSLFLSFFLILIFWPSWVKTLSLQLSFASTLGIILFNKRSNSYLLDEVRTSISAQIFTVPLVFLHFKSISLISPLSNLLVSFLIGPLMILGFLTVILGKISWYMGVFPSFVSYGILNYIVFIIRFLSKLPFSYFEF